MILRDAVEADPWQDLRVVDDMSAAGSSSARAGPALAIIRLIVQAALGAGIAA